MTAQTTGFNPNLGLAPEPKPTRTQGLEVDRLTQQRIRIRIPGSAI